MKLRTCGLTTVFLRHIAGVSAAFVLVSFLSSMGSAETPIERGSYLVKTIALPSVVSRVSKMRAPLLGNHWFA